MRPRTKQRGKAPENMLLERMSAGPSKKAAATFQKLNFEEGRRDQPPDFAATTTIWRLDVSVHVVQTMQCMRSRSRTGNSPRNKSSSDELIDVLSAKVPWLAEMTEDQKAEDQYLRFVAL